MHSARKPYRNMQKKTIENMENDETWIGETWMPKSKEEHEACFSFMSASNWVTGAVIWLTHCVCDFTVNHRNCLKVIFQVRLAELMCTFAPQTFLALKNWRRKNWTWKSTNVNKNKRERGWRLRGCYRGQMFLWLVPRSCHQNAWRRWFSKYCKPGSSSYQKHHRKRVNAAHVMHQTMAQMEEPKPDVVSAANSPVLPRADWADSG